MICIIFQNTIDFDCFADAVNSYSATLLMGKIFDKLYAFKVLVIK